MCALTEDKPAVVIDREHDQEKGLDPSGPRIRCPKCGWSPRREDKWFCACGVRMEHLRYGRDLPGVPPHVEFKRSASSVAAGRRIRSGTRNELLIPRSGTSSESEARLRSRLGSKLRTATQPKPRALREHFVVPSIGSRDVACAEWPNIRRFEHFL